MSWDEHDSDWFDGFSTGLSSDSGPGGFIAFILLLVIVALILYYT